MRREPAADGVARAGVAIRIRQPLTEIVAWARRRVAPGRTRGTPGEPAVEGVAWLLAEELSVLRGEAAEVPEPPVHGHPRHRRGRVS